MTEDYKKTLLDYITELNPGEPVNTETFKEDLEIPRSEWSNYVPLHWEEFKIEGIIKSRTSDKVIFYGGYVVSGGTYENDSRGIIIVTDSYLKPIQTIYKFDSETYLRPIQKMIQEEDGQFVAVDSTIIYTIYTSQQVRQLLMTNQKRVIMLNDISQKVYDKYQVTLRRSYILGNDYSNFICKDIFKNPNSSHYCFMGMRMVNDGAISPDGVRVISLKINVGSANEWWILDSTDDCVYGGGDAYFDSNDDVNWKILLSRSLSNDNKIQVWGGKNSSVNTLETIQDETYSIYIDSVNYDNQIVFVNSNKAYYVQNNQRWGQVGNPAPKYIGLYEVNLTNNTIKEIYLKSLGNYDSSNLASMYLQVVNGELYIQYCDNINDNKADYYIQRYKDVWNPLLVGENKPFIYSQRSFYISQTFNLLKINIFPNNFRTATWYMKQITEIYNLSNYNGEDYENYNSLKGKYGNIYSNNKIIFSRNLHNLSVTNNYTVASVEVPNTFLNDYILDVKELVGETNTTLVSDSTPISKNIYEMLYLNYINTLNVKDNDSNLQINTAKYINSNINVGTATNYNNTKCAKVEIIYEDNSNKIFPIGWERIDDTHKSTEFTIYVDKPILEINLISNDQTTTYITIQRELEEGKYYTFKQYLKVE